MDISKIQRTDLSESNFSINRVENSYDGVDGIDVTMIEAMSDKVSVMQQVKAEISKAMTDPTLISDPGTLLKVQAMLADYQLNIEFSSKIASQLLKGVDTLVKS